MLTVTQYREDVPTEDILQELLAEADNAMHVDCAGQTVAFVVDGWFVFPRGSMSQPLDIPGAA